VNSASVASTARFAIAPATVDPPVAEPLPAAPAETARQFAQALGRAGPLPSPRAADAAPRPASVPSTAPAAATAPPELAAPVAPPLDFAVQAAVAADDAPTADLAPLPLPPAGGAPAANGAPPGQAAAATAPPALQVPLPVGAPDWDRQLGERVGVLVDQGMTSAQLKLSPAHLGPLEIRISLQGDQANVWFGTHSHATREALEAAAPRLRELLGGHGYAQVGVSVDLQQQASRQQAPPSRYEPEIPFAPAEAPAMRGATAGAAARAAGRTRLDAFA
jgi:flagellar hook-length control protein FliK